jgi:hypothetical protein
MTTNEGRTALWIAVSGEYIHQLLDGVRDGGVRYERHACKLPANWHKKSRLQPRSTACWAVGHIRGTEMECAADLQGLCESGSLITMHDIIGAINAVAAKGGKVGTVLGIVCPAGKRPAMDC